MTIETHRAGLNGHGAQNGIDAVLMADDRDPRYLRRMNAIDPSAGPATLHYGDGEFAVLKPGPYVLCAVSGKTTPLEALRYWSEEHQEPYAGPAEALTRMVPGA